MRLVFITFIIVNFCYIYVRCTTTTTGGISSWILRLKLHSYLPRLGGCGNNRGAAVNASWYNVGKILLKFTIVWYFSWVFAWKICGLLHYSLGFHTVRVHCRKKETWIRWEFLMQFFFLLDLGEFLLKSNSFIFILLNITLLQLI